jgi:chemotaxis protein CheD
MGNMIKVGMADMNLCHAPDAITTLGLGSCVGVVIYDAAAKIAGLVHVMLPDSTKIKNNENKAKFADTGIEEMVQQVVAAGATKSRLKAKIAGGAQMFAFSSENDLLRVGARNVEAVKEQLVRMQIPLTAEDTGNSYGRTIEFYQETEELLIKAVGKTTYKI